MNKQLISPRVYIYIYIYIYIFMAYGDSSQHRQLMDLLRCRSYEAVLHLEIFQLF